MTFNHLKLYSYKIQNILCDSDKLFVYGIIPVPTKLFQRWARRIELYFL